MWGFARSILDVLNKHFQEDYGVSIGQSALIQATTYIGYFLMAIPAGLFINRWGYRKGVVLGLLFFGIGSMLFIPSEQMMSFNSFLVSLFVIGCGLVVLETAANPYVTELGSRETAASRGGCTGSRTLCRDGRSSIARSFGVLQSPASRNQQNAGDHIRERGTLRCHNEASDQKQRLYVRPVRAILL